MPDSVYRSPSAQDIATTIPSLMAQLIAQFTIDRVECFHDLLVVIVVFKVRQLEGRRVVLLDGLRLPATGLC